MPGAIGVPEARAGKSQTLFLTPPLQQHPSAIRLTVDQARGLQVAAAHPFPIQEGQGLQHILQQGSYLSLCPVVPPMAVHLAGRSR